MSETWGAGWQWGWPSRAHASQTWRSPEHREAGSAEIPAHPEDDARSTPQLAERDIEREGRLAVLLRGTLPVTFDLYVSYQDGQQGADKCDRRSDRGEDWVLKLLDQPACHWGPRKVCLLQQLQAKSWKRMKQTLPSPPILKLLPHRSLRVKEEVVSHQVLSGSCPAQCRGPRHLGPSRHDRGPVWRERAGTGPGGAGPGGNTASVCQLQWGLCPDPKVCHATHHDDKGAEGQSTDTDYNGSKSEQTQWTETAPPDRAIWNTQSLGLLFLWWWGQLGQSLCCWWIRKH